MLDYNTRWWLPTVHCYNSCHQPKVVSPYQNHGWTWARRKGERVNVNLNMYHCLCKIVHVSEQGWKKNHAEEEVKKWGRKSTRKSIKLMSVSVYHAHYIHDSRRRNQMMPLNSSDFLFGCVFRTHSSSCVRFFFDYINVQRSPAMKMMR